MLIRRKKIVIKLLSFCLITAVFLVCYESIPAAGQRLNPKDPFYLTKKYLADLKSGNNSRKTKAAWELGKSYTKRTPEVVPALIHALNDPYPSVRSNAAGALANIGKEARPAKNALRQSLKDSYGQTVLNAAIALRRLNVPDTNLVSHVRKVLSDEKDTTRVRAVRLLRKMGIKDNKTLAVLAEVITDSHEQAQLDALKELNKRKLRPVPKKISSLVINLLTNSSQKVRMKAALYLGNNHISIPEAKKPLINTLDDNSDLVVKFAARAVGSYGKSAKSAVPKLYVIIDTHPNDDTRGEACKALAHIGIPPKEIARILVKVLSSDKGPKARQGAAYGLRDLKYKNTMVLNALKKASVQDTNSSVRTISKIAYGQLRGK